jgi:aspergillopepsin I
MRLTHHPKFSWVFSTLQSARQRAGRPKVYDPKRTGSRPLTGHTWQISYGDGSGANGQVYLEEVAIGSLSFPNQAIGAAARVSNSFAKDASVDGLLGLAFSRINAIKPRSQLTWFDNIKGKLQAPVFTCALKRRKVSSLCVLLES